MLNDFAQWFRMESGRLRHTPSEQVVDETLDYLTKIDDRIGVEVLRDEQAGDRELILTGFSDPEVFPVIYEIAEALNDIEGWKIVPLKPARGFGFSITVDGNKLAAKDLRFRAIDSIPNGFQLIAPGISVSGGEAEEMAWLIVETGIGEEASGRITHLEFGGPQDRQNSRPISELADSISILDTQR